MYLNNFLSCSKFVQPEELSINQLFCLSKYVIPIYQRNYAWGKDEIEQLLNDINDSNAPYHLGSLIVNKEANNKYSVIDGQQRLTTLFLLLCYLRLKNYISNDSLTFEARPKSNNILSQLEKQLVNDSLEIASDNKNDNKNEITEGFNAISTYFSGKDKDPSFIQNFKLKLNNISIIRVQVPKNIDLNHYFEIMNTRGEQLEIHEIIKAKIINMMGENNLLDRNIAATVWDNCAQMNSYIQMNFKQPFRDKIFSPNWNKFIPEDFDSLRSLYENNNSNIDDVFNSPSSQKKDFSSLFSIINDKETQLFASEKAPEEEKERFESIVSFPNFLLLVNKALNPDDKNITLDDKNFINNFNSILSSKSKAQEFIYNLLRLRFLFDTYIVKREFKGDYKDIGKWSLQKLNMCKYSGESKSPNYTNTYNSDDENYNNLKTLQATLRITYTAPKTMHWLSIFLSTLNKLYKNDSALIPSNKLLAVLENYCCQKVQEADYKNVSGFQTERIIFTYLDYILLRDKIVDIPNFQVQFRNSIEHFYPQHPTGFDPMEETSLNSFGNLALITVSDNSKFSNLDPNGKLSSYEKEFAQSPKLTKMAEILLKENRTWTPEIIENHKKEMHNLLAKELADKLSNV